jgi:hypothetical protein
MSGKSRRHRRHLSRSKRRKSGKVLSAPVAQPLAVAQKPEPASRADASVPSARAPTPKPAVARHPNVATELRRIGIVAGILLIVLVVLFFVLPLTLS